MLAILIPWTHDRQRLFDRVVNQLHKQDTGDIVILDNVDQGHKAGGLSTGAKRNALIEEAIKLEVVTHIAFVDCDDLVGPNYVKHQIAAMEGGYDCAELWGQYYENGKMLNPFHHSIVHNNYADPPKSWWHDSKFYYRSPNHLNCMKLSLVKDIRFRDITIGEDGNWSLDIVRAQVLKKQYPVKEIIYYYFAGSKKDHNKEQQMALARGVKL